MWIISVTIDDGFRLSVPAVSDDDGYDKNLDILFPLIAIIVQSILFNVK